MYIGLNNLGLNSVARVFSPSNLFTAGEQGAWYDPSDLSTMYQDSAGTTPVTAVGQPVGLILDKSRGLALGGEKWVIGSEIVSGEASIVSPGIYRVYSSAGAFAGVGISTAVVGKTYEVTFTIDSFAVVGGGLAVEGSTTPTFTTVGQKRCIISASSVNIYLKRNSTVDCQVSGVSIREIPGNHATQSTSTSRPTLQQDASGYYYLSFDGVDDSLATGNIDFTATDKMTVWAGVHKASDAAAGTVVELTSSPTTIDGSFLISAPNAAAAANFGMATRGTTGLTAASVPSTFAAPITAILQASMDNGAGTQVTRRINGVASTSGSGTSPGNYANAPLYIGRRGGATVPFNGRIYSLIVRGATTSATDISSCERYVAGKTGVTL